MKNLLGVTLGAAAIVFLPLRAAQAQDTLHEDGTWGPGDDEAEVEVEVEVERPARTRRRKLPPVEVEPRVARTTDDQGADRVRFRGGVGLDLGAYLVDGEELALAGIEGRLGIQFGDVFALYMTPSFWVGAGEWDSMGRVALGLVPEITIGDVFFIAAGPELFAVGSSHDDRIGDPLGVGVRTRTGFAFGRKRPGRRHAFTLAFDSRVDFYEEGAGVAPTVGLGYDAF